MILWGGWVRWAWRRGRVGFGGGLRATGGEARGLEGVGHSFQQVSDQGGYGGVVLCGEQAGLAVEFRGDGYGDISDGSHGSGFTG